MNDEEKQLNLNDSDLFPLIGQNFNKIKPYVDNLKNEIKNLNPYTYINFFDDGISFCLVNELIESIYIYNKNIMKFNRY
jgi:hypothetical protein